MRFVDELIPYEEEAEATTASCRPGSAAVPGPGPRARPPRHQHAQGARRRRLLHAPAGPGPGTGGSGHERPGLGASAPRPWFPPVATDDQIERYVIPAIRAEKEECYAITEEGAGSDVDAIVATARRDGDDYILDGVKWHVTSYNTATFAFFQAKLTNGDPCRRARHVHRRPPHRRCPGRAHARLHPHHRPPPPDRGLRGGPGPGDPDGGGRG